MFPDPTAAAKDYFRRTGIFPIMHMVGIRRELVERHAWLPAEDKPVIFGTHGAVAQHYGAAPGTFEPHATTLDYVVAAAAG